MERKKIIGYLFLFAFLLGPIRVLAYSNYFDVDSSELVSFEINRVKAQQIVKSVAELYLYKNANTDYEQKTQDIYSLNSDNTLNYEAKNNYLSKTFSYRNLNMTPFDMSRSNTTVFDCSSFVTNVYLNSFGFNFSDYYSLISSNSAKLNYIDPKYTSESLLDSSIHYQSNEYNENAFYYSGKTVSTLILQQMQRTMQSSNSGESTKDLFVYYKDKASGITQADVQNIKNLLQTGDILLMRRNNSSGHVMIYVKDHISFSGATSSLSDGFIHSTGSDFPATSFTMDTSSFGIDKYSVRYASFDKYISSHFKTSYSTSETYINYIAIIRPLNIILNSKYTNAYTKSYDKVTTRNIKVLGENSYSTSNDGKLSDNYNLSMQQYLYNYTQAEYITSHNVVNSGDVVAVKAYIKNRATQTKKVTIQMNYVDSNTLSYLTYGCKTVQIEGETSIVKSRCSDDSDLTASRNNGLLTFEIVLPPAKSANVYYRFQYTNTIDQEKIVIPGMNLYYGDITEESIPIHFRDLSFVGSTNKLNPEEENSTNVISKINGFYLSNGSKVHRDQSLLAMYNNVFGMDLSNDLGSLTNSTTRTVNYIMNALFDYKSSGNTQEDKINGFYYKSQTSNRVKEYVVKGMYGGTIVRGNTDNERNNQLTFEMLEPGDIVVAYNGASNKSFGSYMFVYGGYENITVNDSTFKNYVVYLRQKNVYICVNSAMNLLKRALVSEAYVVLRPSQVSSLQISNMAYTSSPYSAVLLGDPWDIVNDDVDDLIFEDEDVATVVSASSSSSSDEDVDSDEDDSESLNVSYEVDDIVNFDTPSQVVEVPNTLAYQKIIFIICGVLFILVGLSLFATKFKKNQSNF